MARVRLSLADGGSAVVVDAATFSSAEERDAYLTACEGVRYDPERRARVTTVDRLPAMLRRLRESRIDADVSPEVQDVLSRYEKGWWLDVRGAEDRIAAIDAEIKRQTKGERCMRPDQREGARWLLQRRGALLADQPRVGKSVQTIAALPPRAGVLIVAPAAVKGNWVAEFKKWKPSALPRVLSGRNSFRWPKPGEILITNYDILPDVHDRKRCDGRLPEEDCPGCSDVLVREPSGRMRKRHTGHTAKCNKARNKLPRRECPGCHPLLDECPPETVGAGDEIHRARSRDSARAGKVRALFGRIRQRGGWTWGLSGTPMPNGPLDLWWILTALGVAEEAFGDFQIFKRLFRGKKMDFGGFAWGTPDGEVAERIARVALRRMRRDIMDLAEATHEEVEIDLDPDQIQDCDAALEAVGGADRVIELLEQEKIEFQSMSRVLTALAAAKIPALMTLLDEWELEGDPILVWSMHTAPLEAAASRKGWELLDGSVSLKDRDERIARFQRGELKGLACAITAVGEGIQLSRAGRSVFVDQSWSPTENEQAEDRPVHPDNRGYVVSILKGKHKLDQRITEVNLRKRRIIAASVDAASALANDPKRLHGWDGRLRLVRSAGGVDRTRDDALTERLHAARFDEDRARERVALELAEESAHLGLTAAGRELALEVLDAADDAEEDSRSQGDAKPEPKPDPNPVDESAEESYQEEGPDDLLVDAFGDEHLRECRASATRYGERCSCGSVDEATSLGRREAVARVDEVVSAFRGLKSDDERIVAVEELREYACLECGHVYKDEDDRAQHDEECESPIDDGEDEDEGDEEDLDDEDEGDEG